MISVSIYVDLYKNMIIQLYRFIFNFLLYQWFLKLLIEWIISLNLVFVLSNYLFFYQSIRNRFKKSKNCFWFQNMNTETFNCLVLSVRRQYIHINISPYVIGSKLSNLILKTISIKEIILTTLADKSNKSNSEMSH